MGMTNTLAYFTITSMMVKNIDPNCYKSFFFVSDAEQSTLKCFSLSHNYKSLKSYGNDKHSSLFYQNFNFVEKYIFLTLSPGFLMTVGAGLPALTRLAKMSTSKDVSSWCQHHKTFHLSH
jgi:hypothetical protein